MHIRPQNAKDLDSWLSRAWGAGGRLRISPVSTSRGRLLFEFQKLPSIERAAHQIGLLIPSETPSFLFRRLPKMNHSQLWMATWTTQIRLSQHDSPPANPDEDMKAQSLSQGKRRGRGERRLES
jgi:hypothetical protein